MSERECAECGKAPIDHYGRAWIDHEGRAVCRPCSLDLAIRHRVGCAIDAMPGAMQEQMHAAVQREYVLALGKAMAYAPLFEQLLSVLEEIGTE